MRAAVAYGLLVVFVLVMFIIGIIISLLGVKICVTTFCTKKADLISGSNDPNTNPCKNFYKFVCGNYKNLNTNKPRKISALWEELEKEALMQVVHFLESTSDRAINVILNAGRNVYTACTNLAAIDNEGIDPILNIFKDAYGFPLIEDTHWDTGHYANSFDVVYGETKAFERGFSPVFIGYDLTRYDNGTIPSFWIPSPLYVTQPDFNKCLTFTKELYKILTGKELPNHLEQELIDTVNLKIEVFKIKKVYPTNCTNRHIIIDNDDLDPEDSQSTLGGIKDLPGKCVFGVTVSNVRIPESFREYAKEISEVLKKLNKRVIANYMAIESIIKVIQFLPSKVRNIYDKYIKDEEDKRNIFSNNRRLVCAKLVKDEISTALTASYLFNNPSLIYYHKVMDNLISRIKTNLNKSLKKTKWMDENDKAKAYSVVDTMDFITPLTQNTIQNLTDKRTFSIHYSLSCILADSIIGKYTSLHHCINDIYKKKVDGVKGRLNIFDEKFDIFTTNLKFNFETNTVIVPMVYLQFPAFNEDWPRYLTYSVLGNKLAREAWVGMGFETANENLKDIEEDEEDEEGVTKEPGFWSETTLQNYEKERECFLSQYNDYVKNNNITTVIDDPGCVRENIFDTTAVKLAFLSYKEYHSERLHEEPKLAGMEKYNDDQLFFIDYGSYFCKRKDEKYEKTTQAELGTPTHEFRLVNMLKNFPKFSETFNCKRGDRMNPSKKCMVL